MKRALIIVAVLTSTFAFARGKRVTVTVIASTMVGGKRSNITRVGEESRTSRMPVLPARDEIAIAAEINGQHVILYCDNSAQQHCVGLRAGDYKGEMKGDDVWIKAMPADGKKSKRMKYTIR